MFDFNSIKNTVKTNISKKYNYYFKSKVDASINTINKEGTRSFINKSFNRFSIWFLTCVVYLYSRLEILYTTHYKVHDKASPPKNILKIKNIWSSDVELNKLLKTNNKYKNLSYQDIKELPVDHFESDKKWYTYFTNNNGCGIIICNPQDSDYYNRLMNTQFDSNLKFLSAIIKKPDSEAESDDYINLINMYNNVDKIEVGKIYKTDGTPLLNSEEVLVVIDEDVNNIELKYKDFIFF